MTRNIIRTTRKQCGLTQQELANRIGVNQSYVARLEGEDIKPSLKTAVKLSKALDIPLEQLIRKSDVPIEIIQIFLAEKNTCIHKEEAK